MQVEGIPALIKQVTLHIDICGHTAVLLGDMEDKSSLTPQVRSTPPQLSCQQLSLGPAVLREFEPGVSPRLKSLLEEPYS